MIQFAAEGFVGVGTITDPTDLPNCTGSWEAKDLSLSDGALISTWNNLGSAGGDVHADWGADGPVFKTNQLNGKPVARYTPPEDKLLSNAPGLVMSQLFTASAYTLYSVARPTDAGSAAGTNVWQCKQLFTDLDLYMGLALRDGKIVHWHDNSNKVEIGYTAGTWYIVEIYLSGGAGAVSLNGGTPVTQSMSDIGGSLSGRVAVGGGCCGPAHRWHMWRMTSERPFHHSLWWSATAL